MWLDAPTFEGVDAKGGLPTVAPSRFRRAEVGGPEQRQLEPSDRRIRQIDDFQRAALGRFVKLSSRLSAVCDFLPNGPL